MSKEEQFNQAEELSRCLDSLNNGKEFVTQDGEVEELVELANFIKESYRHDDVPQLLVDKVVDSLAIELKVQKRKRRTQLLYSGLLGTAAAVFIAAFMQFVLPQSTDKHLAQQQQNINSTEKIDFVVAAEKTLQSTSAIIAQQAQPENNTEMPVSVPVENKSVHSIAKVVTEMIQVAQTPEIEQKSNEVAMLRKETPKDIAMRKSAVMSKTETSSLQEQNDNQPKSRMPAMVLPNQTTSSIMVDNTNGIIRQVYNQGTNDEISITQGLLNESRVQSRGETKQGEVQGFTRSSAAERINKEPEDVVNSLTVTVDKYHITIEGKKTKEELQAIAETLTEEEMKK
jgi:hypothetical protein